ncbi:putative inactive purple acid phosphatase 1-like protein, partial [Trifolium pratense]
MKDAQVCFPLLHRKWSLQTPTSALSHFHLLPAICPSDSSSASFNHEDLTCIKYTYKLGHRLVNGTTVWSQEYQFKSSPYPGQNSVQRVVIFGDMGK